MTETATSATLAPTRQSVRHKTVDLWTRKSKALFRVRCLQLGARIRTIFCLIALILRAIGRLVSLINTGLASEDTLLEAIKS